MSEVHKAISQHSRGQHETVKTFIELDNNREKAIEEAVAKCLQKQPYSVNHINTVTTKINELAKQKGIVPTRKLVTIDMVQEYADKLKK